MIYSNSSAIGCKMCESCLVSGFFLKRLSSKFGFWIGNFIQSMVFGLLHGAMFISKIHPGKAFLILAFTGMIAWCMGYANEKKAGGSIFPS